MLGVTLRNRAKVKPPYSDLSAAAGAARAASIAGIALPAIAATMPSATNVSAAATLMCNCGGTP